MSNKQTTFFQYKFLSYVWCIQQIKTSGPKRSEKSLSYKSPLMEFQAIPKPNQEELLLHFSHHHHPLVLVNLPYLFTCMGCKEFGAGKRLTCQICDFVLHDFCAFAPASLTNHPFHHNHHLVFNTKSGKHLESYRHFYCI